MEKTLDYKKSKKRAKARRALFISAMLFFPVLHFVIMNIFIGFSTFAMSFQRYNLLKNTYEWAGLYNFKRVIDELTKGATTSVLTHAIINSLEFYVVMILILMPLGMICAYFFWRNMPGAKIFRVAFFLPSLIPGVVLPLLFALMLDSSVGVLNPLLRALGLGKLIPANGWLGDYNTAQPMVLFYTLWSGVGGNIIIYAGNLNRMPQEIFESARLDGISMMKELWHIVIPLMWPIISISIVTGSLVVFNVYIPSLMLTAGGPSGRTMTIAYMIIEWTNNGELTIGSAAGLFFSIIGVPLIMLLKWGLGKFTPEVEY